MSDEWVMVPRVPNEAMLLAGGASLHAGFHTLGTMRYQIMDSALIAYRAMIDAAPAAPAAPQQADPVAKIEVSTDFQRGGVLLTRLEMHRRLPDGYYNLFLHPPAAEVQRVREAAGVVMKQWAAKDELALAIAMNELRRALEG